MNKIFGKSRGQVAVLYAGVIAVLLGAVALTTDVAVMYVNWQQAQKVADAAAIAGANYLNGGITYADPTTGTAYPTSSGCNGEQPGSSPEEVATQVACTYAVKNGMAAGTVTLNVTATTLQVTIRNSNLPYLFGNALGSHTYNVAASATAAAGGSANTVLGKTSNSTDEGLFPIGLQCPAPCGPGSLVAGQNVSFGVKFISATLNSSTAGCGGACGNWDWIGPDGKGSSSIAGDIANGVQNAYAVSPNGSCGTNSVGAPYCIDSAPGNKSNAGPIKGALKARLGSCPALSIDPCSDGGNPNDIPAGDPCLVIMPAVDFAGVTGSKPMPIEQFAEVYLEPDSTPTNLDGCFISTVAGDTLSVTTTSSTTTVQTGVTSPPTLTN